MLLAGSMIMGILSPGAMSAAISEGYSSTQALAPDTLVSIDTATNQVKPADTANNNGLLGVVVGGQAATLSIDNPGKNLQVATSGTTDLFVTDLNGPIKPGDQIAPSPIEGVGMKASSNGKIVGLAQDGFSGGKTAKTVTVTTKTGSKHIAHIGTVPAVIQVAYYSTTASAVPGFLQQFANSVAGKPVALGRLIAVALILLVALLLVAILLFSAVRGALVSVGRNPLAKTSIYRGLSQVIGISLAILGVAMGSAFVILTY